MQDRTRLRSGSVGPERRLGFELLPLLALLGLELLGAALVPADDETARARQRRRLRRAVASVEIRKQLARGLDVVEVPEAVLQPRQVLEIARRALTLE